MACCLFNCKKDKKEKTNKIVDKILWFKMERSLQNEPEYFGTVCDDRHKLYQNICLIFIQILWFKKLLKRY